MYNLRKRAVIEKSGKALKESQKKEDRPKVVVQKPSKSRPKARGFSSLPRHLQELVLLKTSTETRLKLFQVNERLRKWVFKEGLFTRDVQRIETAYRPKRPREKVTLPDYLEIFKILPRSGLGNPVEIDVADAKKSMALKNIRSCRDLVVKQGRDHKMRIVDFFPNLRSLGTCDISFWEEAHFEALFVGTSLEITLAWKVSHGMLGLLYEGKLNKLFEWIDKYASRCPSISFDNISCKGTVQFLKTRKLRFIQWQIYSERGDGEIVEMILKNGIPGEHPDPCIRFMLGPGLTIQVMSILTKNNTLVIGDLKRILKKFMDHRAEVGWHLDTSVLESNALGFTIRFDESKNLIFLLFEDNDGVADLLVKYEPIEKCI